MLVGLAALAHGLGIRARRFGVVKALGASLSHDVAREVPSFVLARAARAYVIEYSGPPAEALFLWTTFRHAHSSHGDCTRYPDQEVRAAYAPSQTRQGSDLMRTDAASTGGYASTLFTQCRTRASENTCSRHVGE